MKKTIPIIIIVFAVVMYIGWRFVYYGSLTRNCIYTEEKIPVPKLLAEGRLITTQKAFEAIGVESKEEKCSPMYGNIARTLTDAQTAGYYSSPLGNSPMIVKELPVGKVFRVVNAFAQTKHGISTIDSGPGPIEFLVLEDEQGIKYTIATVSIGMNKEELFLKYISPIHEQMLDTSVFWEKKDNRGRGLGGTGLKFFHLENKVENSDVPEVKNDTSFSPWSQPLAKTYTEYSGIKILNGYEMTTTKTTDKTYPNYYASLRTKYNALLSSFSYIADLKDDADGVFGSRWGYIKDGIHIIFYSEVQDPYAIKNNNAPYEFACPCENTLTVFSEDKEILQQIASVQPQQNESAQKQAQTVKTYKGGLFEFQYPSSWIFEQTGQIIDFHLPSDEIWTEPGSSIPLSLAVKVVDKSLYTPVKYIDAEKTYEGHIIYQAPEIKKLSCANTTKTVETYKDETIEMGYDIITKMSIEKNGKIFEFSFSYGVNGYCMNDALCRVDEEKIIAQNEEVECKILSSVTFPN